MRTEKIQTLAHRETLILGSERWGDLWDEIAPLLTSHHEEVSHFPDTAVKMARENYERMQSVGALFMVTMRVDSDVKRGELIGYCSVVKHNHSHTGQLVARVDAVYVRPEWRSGTDAGRALLKHAMKIAENDGCQAFYVSSRPRHDLGTLLSWMGFDVCETQYVKRLAAGGD